MPEVTKFSAKIKRGMIELTNMGRFWVGGTARGRLFIKKMAYLNIQSLYVTLF